MLKPQNSGRGAPQGGNSGAWERGASQLAAGLRRGFHGSAKVKTASWNQLPPAQEGSRASSAEHAALSPSATVSRASSPATGLREHRGVAFPISTNSSFKKKACQIFFFN